MYIEEPIFKNSKIVTSLYGNKFDKSLNKKMINKILFDEIDKKFVNVIKNPTYDNLMKIALILRMQLLWPEKISSALVDYIKDYKNPILKYKSIDEFSEAYLDFYNKLFLIFMNCNFLKILLILLLIFSCEKDFSSFDSKLLILIVINFSTNSLEYI